MKRIGVALVVVADRHGFGRSLSVAPRHLSLSALLATLIFIVSFFTPYPTAFSSQAVTSIPDTGFESGSTTGWDLSSTSPTTFSSTLTGSGQGAGFISGQVLHSHAARGGGGCEPAGVVAANTPGWQFSPSGAYAGALQPSGSATFDAAATALGLLAGDVTAIKAVIASQAGTPVGTNPACGGAVNPTNAAWMKRVVTLSAGTTYRMAWNYIGTDYVPFNDGSLTSLVWAGDPSTPPVVTVNNQTQSYALLGFTNPGTGDYSTGSYGSTGWQYSTYSVSITGLYSLGFASFNIGDTSLSPVLLIDDSLGTVLKNGVAFAAVAPNNPNAPSISGPEPEPVVAPGSAPAVVVEEEPVVAPPVSVAPPVRTFDPVQQPIPSSSSSAAIRQGPTLLVGGRPSNLQVDVPSSQRLELSEGDLSISLRLPAGAGNISQQNGTTALSVEAGSTMSFAGSGLRPGTFAQVFLPLGGGQDSVELGRYEIGDDGGFSRPVALDTMPSSSMPIAIGPQVLQIVSYDSDGNQIALDLLVNVTQPLPAPEFNRSTGEIPGLLPGNSLATRAGIPVPLTVTGLSDQKLVVLEGDGWSIGLNVVNDSGTVESTADGASVTLVRDKPLEISGTGFMPGTRADVWLFSDPTLVGSAIVTESGEFFAEVLVDSNFVAVGEHTIQLQGIGEDGYVRSANLGVAVGDNILATEAERVYAPWWTLLLIGLGLVLFGSLRRWGPIRGNLAHNLASAAVLFTATPAVVLGWISTVTAISWWGLALGLVALILYRFIRPRHPHLG